MEQLLNIIYNNVSNALNDAAGEVRIALADATGPFLVLLITCMFAYYAISMAFQRRLDIPGLLYFGFRSLVIYSLVIGGVYWSDIALPFVEDFGENVGKVIFEATYTGDGGSGVSSGSDFAGFIPLLTEYIEQVYEVAQELSDSVEGGTITYNWQEITAAFLFAFAVVFAVIVVAISFIILIACKILLYIFLSISPLFIVWAFFGGTQSIFQGWMRGLINVLTAQVLIYAVLGITLAVAAEANEYLSTNAGTASGAAPEDREILLQLLFLCFTGIIGIILLGMVPRISAAVSGGGITIGQSIAQMQQQAMARGAAATAGGAAAGAAAGVGAANTAARTAVNAGISRIRNAGGGADAATERQGAADEVGAGRPTAAERARRNLDRKRR